MRFDAVIFDFDGTLVASAESKYEAFFRIFPDTPQHREVIAAVLKDDPDGSRHVVIPRMVGALGRLGLIESSREESMRRVERYADAVFDIVSRCDELPGATDILVELKQSGVPVYISSNTPQESIEKLVQARKWDSLVRMAYGYPAAKAQTARAILDELGIEGSKLAVVGDGVSDRESAAEVGAIFFPIDQPLDLSKHAMSWGLLNVGS